MSFDWAFILVLKWSRILNSFCIGWYNLMENLVFDAPQFIDFNCDEDEYR